MSKYMHGIVGLHRVFEASKAACKSIGFVEGVFVGRASVMGDVCITINDSRTFIPWRFAESGSMKELYKECSGTVRSAIRSKERTND